MLVHRDNDDQSGDERPGNSDKSPMAAGHAGADGALPAAQEQDGQCAPEEGKTHLIGDALKSVYQRTLEENIPDDFLDLLKQLK